MSHSNLRRRIFGRFLMAALIGAMIFILVVGQYRAAYADDAGGTAYTIKLSRPSKVGDKDNISGNATQKMTTTIALPGQPPQVQNQSLSVQLEGTIEVLAVDSKGEATKYACTVQKLVRTGDDAGEVLPPGAIFIVDSTGGAAGAPGSKTQYTIQGGQITPEQSVAIALVSGGGHPPESPTDDETFGNAQPQQLGASWSINTANAAASLRSQGTEVTEQDIKGHTKLVGVKEVDGKKFLDVQTEMTAENFKTPLPPGVALQKSTLDFNFSGSYPIDVSSQDVFQDMDLNAEIVGTGQNGAITVTTVMNQHSEGKIIHVSDGPAKP